MNTAKQAAAAYGCVQMSALAGPSLDALVLLKAASKLQSVFDRWDTLTLTGDLEPLSEALRYNQRLWTIYQVDLASPDSDLPLELRRNLLTISRFVDRCTLQLLASPQRRGLKSLIDINRNLAEGLERSAPKPACAELQPGSFTEQPDEVFDLCL